MKLLVKLSTKLMMLVLFFMLVLPFVALAQEIIIPANADSTQLLIMSAIVALTPALINLLKKAIYEVKVLPDGSKTYVPPAGWAPWVLTIAPPVVAAVLGWLSQLIPGVEATNTWLYFGLGVLAHYIRKLAVPITGAITNTASNKQLLEADPNRVR